MTWDDREYYRFRAGQETAAAVRAGCDVARDRHLELAALYRRRGAGEEMGFLLRPLTESAEARASQRLSPFARSPAMSG